MRPRAVSWAPKSPSLSILCVKNRAFGITECLYPRERDIVALTLKVCFHLSGMFWTAEHEDISVDQKIP